MVCAVIIPPRPHHAVTRRRHPPRRRPLHAENLPSPRGVLHATRATGASLPGMATAGISRPRKGGLRTPGSRSNLDTWLGSHAAGFAAYDRLRARFRQWAARCWPVRFVILTSTASSALASASQRSSLCGCFSDRVLSARLRSSLRFARDPVAAGSGLRIWSGGRRSAAALARSCATAFGSRFIALLPCFAARAG